MGLGLSWLLRCDAMTDVVLNTVHKVLCRTQSAYLSGP